MKKTISFLMLCFIITSCKYVSNKDKAVLELTGSGNNMTLVIRNFKWGYGITSFNQFNGDFDELDRQVFTLLKGKSNSCVVNLEYDDKDKYGNATKNLQTIGAINIDELNKYQSVEYWSKDAGIRKMIYRNVVNAPHTSSEPTMAADSTPIITSQDSLPIIKN